MKTVKEVSKLTGISVRTLHYYDEIGLFRPTEVTEAGYRLYDDKALEKLGQILVFRELDLPLADIKLIMDNPDLDYNSVLAKQREMLFLKKQRLERIIANGMLPEVMDGANTGRADMTAVKALLAKVYATHYQKGDAQYARARQLCLEVLQGAKAGNPTSAADLVPYPDIFSTSNEMNKEILFTVRYLSGNVGLGSPFGNMFAPINNAAIVIIGTSNNYNTPSDNLIAAYQSEGDVVRFNTNISQGYYNPTTQATVNVNYCKKYLTPVTTQFDGESDWPLLRVGDIALLFAELDNELNGPTSTALNYLNMIRQRAGIATYDASDLSTTYDFREAVRLERRLELAFENQRWFDLQRWETTTNVVNKYLATEAFYAGYSYEVKPIAEWQTMLPVPVSVFNINPQVAQNVGY